MDPTDASRKPAAPTSTAHPGPEPTTEPTEAAQQPLGPDAASILAAESWSLLATRSLLWNDRISRTTIFLTVLSPRSWPLPWWPTRPAWDPPGLGAAAGGAAHRAGDLPAPGGDRQRGHAAGAGDEPGAPRLPDDRAGPEALLLHRPPRRPAGLRASLLVAGPHDLHPWAHFLVTAPTLVATVDAAIATAIVVLLLQATAAPPVAVVAAGAVAFLVGGGARCSR
jgi:hypothetical protein